MSDSKFDTTLRMTQTLALIVIPIVLFVFVQQIMKMIETPPRVVVEDAQYADPENDFAGLWELTWDCSKAGLTRHHGLGKYSIFRNLDDSFSLDVSIEFANGDEDTQDGWNTADLRYCEEEGEPNAFCEAKERAFGLFDCDQMWPFKSDFLAGQATIDGHLHNIFAFLIYNPNDGSTRPIVTYDDSEVTEEHRGILH